MCVLADADIEYVYFANDFSFTDTIRKLFFFRSPTNIKFDK